MKEKERHRERGGEKSSRRNRARDAYPPRLHCDFSLRRQPAGGSAAINKTKPRQVVARARSLVARYPRPNK